MPPPKVTINDVAELAGVSIKTVSRVANGEPNVRESTRERVEAAIKQLKYRPNRAARNLASHRSHLITLVYDDPSAYESTNSGYVLRMQEGVLSTCHATGYELLIHPCNYRNLDAPAELQTMIEQTRTDGIVLAAPLSNMPKIVAAITETGTALACLSPGTASMSNYAVVTNDRSVCTEMTAYLASLGHRRIAFIKGDPKHAAVANRFSGYQDGLAAAGLELSAELIGSGDSSMSSGEACADLLLALEDRPTAIFAANDDMAAGVMRVAHRLGISVPGELSVAGFDDSSMARQIYPALTSIRQPLAAMAEQAAASLIHSDDTTNNQTDVVASSIVLRESTGPAAR